MKIVAIIQARMGSTRLPGKIMKKVLNKPLFEYQIERVKRSKLIDEIVVATTTKKSEQPIINLCEHLSIPYFRGSEDDVLSRYYEAARKYQADVIVRLTSDCPIIDPVIIDKVVNAFLTNKEKYDYASNTLKRTYPRGMDTEVFPIDVLEKAHNEANFKSEREHVTPYIYNNPLEFNLLSVENSNNASKYRWTVDTKEDLLLISRIISTLYKRNDKFNLKEILELIHQNPNWSKINETVEQKSI
ncbi:spore coat polysaccharide biosynthesis protein SpsF [Oceanobacillus limi]|uniref:Spore coat polysaccharide biosynthesis protein SpsF n=1 Tax=Oceanobacillus limi TaxID=930131 RepID=A0A1I0BLS4_9BACI|nr:glycosyltransferase family protein [Oceanobacillus limi]SET07614.1 spore coat polysaccharide biosynthesis protein SpsF [Oceanobacillus limi]